MRKREDKLNDYYNNLTSQDLLLTIYEYRLGRGDRNFLNRVLLGQNLGTDDGETFYDTPSENYKNLTVVSMFNFPFRFKK